jgi:glycosyltransferase involved in cell wall biosynthesis
MTPKVSVVMPVRNGARWLSEAITSVLLQTLPDFELVVVDDGSSDKTPQLLSEFAKRDRRIRIIRQEPLGLVAALNSGLCRARAPLLARLDADDRAMPERLEHQVRYLRANPEIGLLGSWAQKLDAQGKSLGWLRPETRSEELVRILIRTNPFIHSSVIFRTEIAVRLAGYRSAFRAAEDYDLWLRMVEITKIANLPEVLVEYRWHGTNVTNRQGILQAFSMRLAQRSAKGRRETGVDPADYLTDPPDWHSSRNGGSFYADEASLYRILDFANAAAAKINVNGVDLSPLLERFSELSHTERKLATDAMINHIKRANWSRALGTCLLLLRLLARRVCRKSHSHRRRRPKTTRNPP